MGRSKRGISGELEIRRIEKIRKRGRYCEIYKSSKNKMAGTCKENGSGSDAKKDDGRKTVCRKKKRRKT